MKKTILGAILLVFLSVSSVFAAQPLTIDIRVADAAGTTTQVFVENVTKGEYTVRARVSAPNATPIIREVFIPKTTTRGMIEFLNLVPNTKYALTLSATASADSSKFTPEEYSFTTTYRAEAVTKVAPAAPSSPPARTTTPQTVTPPSVTRNTQTNTSTGSTQPTGFDLGLRIKNPLKINTIQDAVRFFVNTVVKLAIPVIVIFFLWSGLNFILAQGNKEKLAKARSMFFNTIIGTLLILGAWTITNAIVGTINSITG